MVAELGYLDSVLFGCLIDGDVVWYLDDRMQYLIWLIIDKDLDFGGGEGVEGREAAGEVSEHRF